MSKSVWGLSGFDVTTSSTCESTTSSDKGITRNVLVHITGNRAVWEHAGVHGAVWRINHERAGFIFGCDGDCTSDALLNEKLSRAMIRSVTVLESNSNIDEIVGVHIDGLPCKEFTAAGDGASLFLTGEGRVTQQQELFNMSGNTELGLAWMRKYPRYTHENLDKVGIMLLTGASYYFVDIDHPAIHMLRANEDTLGVHISPEPAAEGRWYKVEIDAFMFCVQNIRDNILQNTPSTFNLSHLTVRIAKPDGARWLDVRPQLIDSLISDEIKESNDVSLIAEARQLAVRRYLDRPLFVTLRIAFEYSLPETGLTSQSLASASCGGNAASGCAAVSNNNVAIVTTSANMLRQHSSAKS
jgi:hypothetical protein